MVNDSSGLVPSGLTTDYWILTTVYWLLPTDYWLLVTDY